jgi:hypothetical protein
MHAILEQLKNDPGLDNFYDLEDAEREKCLSDIVQLYINHEADLKAYCLSVIPTYFCELEPVYEALSYHETEAIGTEQFLTSEFIRIFNAGKSASDVAEYTSCLDDIEIDFEKNKTQFDKIIAYLTGLLDHERITVKYRALELLYYWITMCGTNRYSSTLDKIKSDLQHQDWKIRWLTYHKLKNYELADKAELKLSLMDRVRGWINNPENLLL